MSVADSLKSIVYKDWQRIAESVVKKRGKRLKDLQFAKRTTHGYAFFEDIEHSLFDMIEEITQELSHLYPDYDYALLAETSSELANQENSTEPAIV